MLYSCIQLPEIGTVYEVIPAMFKGSEVEEHEILLELYSFHDTLQHLTEHQNKMKTTGCSNYLRFCILTTLVPV